MFKRFGKRNAFRRRFKRRFTGRRFRRFGGSKRSFATTQQHGPILGLRYRGRRRGLKSYRRNIFNASIFASHYRAVLAEPFTQATAAAQGIGIPAAWYPEKGGGVVTAATGFWTAAGGLQPLDTGAALPTFTGDILLRGGKIGINISCLDANVLPLHVDVWLVFVQQKAAGTAGSFLPATAPLGWDLSIQPEFLDAGGKVLKHWSALLDYQSKTLTIEHKLRARKIDKAVHNTGLGQFYFITNIVNLGSAAAVTCQIIKYHNVSFASTP